MDISFSGLPRPVPCAGGSGSVIGAAVVGQRLAGPHLAADLDDLAGAQQRPVERHAVPAFDDLRPRAAEAEVEAPARQCVDRGGRLGDERRRPRVDREDAGHQLERGGLTGQVRERRHEIEAVDLARPHQIDPGGLEVSSLAGVADRIAVESERGGDLHNRILVWPAGRRQRERRIWPARSR